MVSAPLCASLDDVARLCKTDPRLASTPVKHHDGESLELALPDGTLRFLMPSQWRDRAALARLLPRTRAGELALVMLGSEDDFESGGLDLMRDETDLDALVLPVGVQRLLVTVRNVRERQRMRHEAAEGARVTQEYRSELDELYAIGRALSSERDLDKLLALILEKCRSVTGADAGSVYVVEGTSNDISERTLRFKVSQNDSVKLDFTEFSLPVSEKSIVGRCVLSRDVINIPDLYRLDAPGSGNNMWGFKHNRDFDLQNRYQTHSMLTVPMIDAGDHVIGVVQLINKKRDPDAILAVAEDFQREVISFDQRSSDLASALASQAGISLENAMLYDDIRLLFEGFVRASVTAIEQRDPSTSGHSQRVSDLTCGLAKVTDRVDDGPYSDYGITFDDLKQIEYAALLHDFGKVGVRENVLVKAKKLYEADREIILSRFDFIKKTLESERSERKVETLLARSRDEALVQLPGIDAAYAQRLAELDDFIAVILKSNEPTVLDQGGFERLAEVAARKYLDPRGEEQPYLRPMEVETLQIMRGSLTHKERLEIESHVGHTYNFLRTIPWGRHFKDIPEIAGAHHEKLDGTGYPRGIKAEGIPVAARMMAISDIFDALTASDRPYKKAVPVPKALDIIGSEVRGGKLDAELYRIFIEARVYQLVIPSGK